MTQQSFRNIDGILLLDKPTGITSNAALQVVKRMFRASKAGHTGSLDPLASGMLPICFGEATKFSQFLLEADKHYRVTAKLGIKTDSGDAEGEIIEQRAIGDISIEKLLAVLSQFHGEIQQVPSMFSALKHKGQPLYKLARKGITIERNSRPVRILQLTLIDYQTDTLTLEVRCSKGTYIRTLVEDIGEALGCGAHVTYLRRIAAASYQEQQMISLDDLTRFLEQDGLAKLDALLLPLVSCVQTWPILSLSSTASHYLRKGQAIMVPQAPQSGWVQLLGNEGQFIGVGEMLADGKVAPRRLVRATLISGGNNHDE